jgi:tRNA (cytidine32/uridine32-2'-O)-methyltransferase
MPDFSSLTSIRMVLVNTSLARNIGSAARAMKVMGLTKLYLVNPKEFPHADATALAAGAEDVLMNAVVCPDLASAVSDCQLVFGTSARRRDVSIPELAPASAAIELLALTAQTAIVFGSERTGLDNSDLALCHARIHIPTNPDYSSLNLASAVQLISYELRLASAGERTQAPDARDLHIRADHADFERLVAHFERYLAEIEFYSNKSPEKLMLRLRRLLQRAGPSDKEIQLLRGILSESSRRLGRKMA